MYALIVLIPLLFTTAVVTNSPQAPMAPGMMCHPGMHEGMQPEPAHKHAKHHRKHLEIKPTPHKETHSDTTPH